MSGLKVHFCLLSTQPRYLLTISTSSRAPVDISASWMVMNAHGLVKGDFEKQGDPLSLGTCSPLDLFCVTYCWANIPKPVWQIQTTKSCDLTYSLQLLYPSRSPQWDQG